MAVLTAKAESSSGFQIDELAPSGDYVATCLDIADEFSVPRRKYQSEEMEDVDVTRFLFGFKAQDGKLYKVQTFEMKISGSPKSTLYKFLSAWLGKAPDYGWDYCSLKGQGAVISVEHVVSQMGTTYPKIARLTPAKTSLADYSAQIVPASQFGVAPTPSAAPAPVAPVAPAPVAPAPVASAPAAWSPETGNSADCPF
jgi:hypothetical protein